MRVLDPKALRNLQFKRSRRFDPGKEFGRNLPDAPELSAPFPPGSGMTDTGEVIFPKTKEEIMEDELRIKINKIRKKRGFPQTEA